MEETETRVELAWAAGLFEGEGSICISTSNGHSYLRIQMQMSDKKVMDRFVSIIGYGRVRGPVHRPNRAVMWDWAVTGGPAEEILSRIDFSLHLSERRWEKIERVRQRIAEGKIVCV